MWAFPNGNNTSYKHLLLTNDCMSSSCHFTSTRHVHLKYILYIYKHVNDHVKYFEIANLFAGQLTVIIVWICLNYCQKKNKIEYFKDSLSFLFLFKLIKFFFYILFCSCNILAILIKFIF